MSLSCHLGSSDLNLCESSFESEYESEQLEDATVLYEPHGICCLVTLASHSLVALLFSRAEKVDSSEQYLLPVRSYEDRLAYLRCADLKSLVPLIPCV